MNFVRRFIFLKFDLKHYAENEFTVQKEKVLGLVLINYYFVNDKFHSKFLFFHL